MKIWFTADQHWGHKNILKYCNRPFTDVHEMNEALIAQWNAVVGPSDIVYHLGDLSFQSPKAVAELFRRLNGWVRLLCNPWHHDGHWLKSGRFIGTTVDPLVVLEGSKLEIPAPCIVLCHYPLAEWDRKHYGSWHLHGHTHGQFGRIGHILDVGVDQAAVLFRQYRPISLEEVSELMQKESDA